MPNPRNLTSSLPKTNDDKADTAGDSGGTVSVVKEKEPAKVQDTMVAIQERAAEADEVAEREIKSVLKDARLSAPEPRIPQDLRQAGVESPQREASEIIRSGAGLQISLTEEKFQQAEHTKFSAKVTERNDVIGVSSIIAFAMLIGRILKMAHGKMKVVFRKNGEKTSS